MHAVTLHPVRLFLPLSLLDVPYIYGKSSRRLFAWSAVDTNPQSEPPSVVDGRANGLDAKVRTPLHAVQAPRVSWLYGGPLWKYNGLVRVTLLECWRDARRRFCSLSIESRCSAGTDDNFEYRNTKEVDDVRWKAG